MEGFLTELHVSGYACLKNVKCTLTPLHAFIGPNDSGKSTLLGLIEGLGVGFAPLTRVFARFVDGSDLRINEKAVGIQVTIGGGDPRVMSLADAQHLKVAQPISVRVGLNRERAQLVRLNADELRLPSSLIQHGQPLVLDGRGRNIAGLFDAVRDRSIERFAAISQQVTQFFPTVKTLGLRALNPNTKVLMVTLTDGTEVPSSSMSEGLLYYLAFAILSELQRPDVYLVEEPENGLHPSRIADIVRMLRAITVDPKNPVQVIMATHSPLVVNELRPEEVTVVTRTAVEGTKCRLMKDTPNFSERSKVYALGELWVSYADGNFEGPLFTDPEPTPTADEPGRRPARWGN